MANTKKKIETETETEPVGVVEAKAIDVADEVEAVETTEHDWAVECPDEERTKYQIKVKRVNNAKLEEALQEIGYHNVAQILVEPSLGYAMFNIVYWGEVTK